MTDNINLILGLLVLVLIIFSAFFSLVETALGTCSRARIHHLVKDGDKKAIKVEQLLKSSESAMSTILLCYNTINIIASTIATGVLIKIFGESGMIYATVIMTVLVVVFGEIAPKTYSLKNAEKIILFSGGFVLWLVKFLSPITESIHNIIDKTFDLFQSKKNKKETKIVSDIDEIRGTIELKHKAGSIFKYEKDMLDSILDLGETEIINIMVHRKNIVSIDIDQDLKKILKQAFEINHSKIPLWRETEDNIVAILNMRKLITALHNKQGNVDKINLKEFTSPPWFIPSSNTIKNQLIAFRHKKEKFALVIDEYGALMGIITMEDILEEIVGDLTEKEDNTNKARIVKFKDGSYKISGEATVRDINRKLNWNIAEDDDASTLAGLLISKIERIPEEKEEFIIENFTFKVLKVRENKVIFLNIRKNITEIHS